MKPQTMNDMSFFRYPLTEGAVIINLHTPGTMGTSWETIFQKTVIYEHSTLRYFQTPTDRSKLGNWDDIIDAKHFTYDIVSGLWGFDVISIFPPMALVPIIMLHHPVQRAINLYRHHKAHAYTAYHQEIHEQSLSLIDFVKKADIQKNIAYGQVAGVLGTDTLRWKEDVTNDHISQAQEQLADFAVVGVMSHLKRSIDLFEHIFDWQLAYDSTLQHTSNDLYHAVSKKDRGYITDLATPDLTLFEYAQDIVQMTHSRLPKPKRNKKQRQQTTYIICTTPRTGSNLLCDLLKQTDLAGEPTEYFIPEQEHFSRYDIADNDYGVYIDALLKQTSSSNHIFGFKIMSWHFDYFVSSLRQTYHLPHRLSTKEVIDFTFTNVRYICLTRENEVKRAISHLRAIQSDIWSSWEARSKEPAQTPVYSEADITKLIRQNRYAMRYWDQYFAENEIEPLTMTYEQLLKDKPTVIKSVLKHIGVSDYEHVEIPEAALKKQSNKESARWYEQYMQANPL